MYRLLAVAFVARALASCTWLQNVHTDAGCCSQTPPDPYKSSICNLTSSDNIWSQLLNARPGTVTGRAEFDSLSADIVVAGSASVSVRVNTSYSTTVATNTTDRVMRAGSVYDQSVVLGDATLSTLVLGNYSNVIVVAGQRYVQQPVKVDQITVLAHVLQPAMNISYSSPCDSSLVPESRLSGACTQNLRIICLDSRTAVVQAYTGGCETVPRTMTVSPGVCYRRDSPTHASFPDSFIVWCD